MRNRLSLLTLLLVLFTNLSIGQMVGTSCFLQGRFVEIGILQNGSLGPATGSPAGYHPHSPGTGVGAALAEVYDYGHDGWAVGTPPYMGDYTYPGSPFEGWEIQANGQRAQGYQWWGTGFMFSGGGTMTGSSLTSYSNTGGVARNVWQGTTYGGNLAMRMETRVDTTGDAVVMTVVMKNTSGTAIPGVYYWRSCDPDNDQTWPGGGFFTNNVINYQNTTIPNPTHKVMVTGTGASSTLPPLTLCTKDCRAVAVIYNSWGLTVSQDLAQVWNQTYGGGGAFYNVGVNHPGDIGIGIVWNLGTIAPGDSAVIAYAYVFNGVAGIDDPGALPDPQLKVNNVVITSFPDTLDGCLLPGVDSVPVSIPFGGDRVWAHGVWTWTPSTGLSTTVGINNFVRLNAIPGTITYTVTGKDTVACHDTYFVFTVKTCHLAYVNDPCIGGALYFGMMGDSLGASYFWYGPGGFTSSLHNPVIYPSTWLDTGTYHVVRTIGGVSDTDEAHVLLHPLPIVAAASSIPNCGVITSPLNLTVNLDSAGETFLWSGPLGFTSTVQNPVISPFDSTMQGTYTVIGTTKWGCSASSSVDIHPGITPIVVTDIHRGCEFDTVYFYNKSINADTYDWNFGDGTPPVYTRSAMHVFNKHQVWSVMLRMTNAHCAVNYPITVDTRHDITAKFTPTPDTLCVGNSVNFTDSSWADDSSAVSQPTSWAWHYGDGYPVETGVINPSHPFNQPGTFPVKLVVTDRYGCPDSVRHDVFVIQLSIKAFDDTLLCLSQPLPLYNTIDIIPEIDLTDRYQYSWTESSPNLSDNDVKVPFLTGIGVFTDVLTVTIPGIFPDGCPASHTYVVNSVMGKKLMNLTPSQTIDYGDRIQLNASNEIFYYWMPNDGTLDNNNINNPIARPEVTTTYTVFGFDDNGCKDSAYITIFVDTSVDQGVPTAFTPNGDGKNDVFLPVGIHFQRMVEFRVFNRWGQELFFTNQKNVGWDGTYHGTPQDLGVYNYLIIVSKPDGNNVMYKGNVTLIR